MIMRRYFLEVGSTFNCSLRMGNARIYYAHHTTIQESNAVIPAKSTLPLWLDFCRRLFLSCSSERAVWGTERLYSSGIVQQIQVDTQKNVYIYKKSEIDFCDHIASSYIKTEATSLLEGITVRITRWMKSLCYILARWQDKQAKKLPVCTSYVLKILEVFIFYFHQLSFCSIALASVNFE